MTSSSLLRLLLVIAVLVAGYFVVRGFAGPAKPRAEQASGDPVPPVVGTQLDDAAKRQLLPVARALLAGGEAPKLEEDGPAGERLVFLSLSRPQATALVAAGRGKSAGAALAAAAAELRGRASEAERQAGRLKVDVLSRVTEVQRFDAKGRGQVNLGLDGLWLAQADLWLLPEEITARALVDDHGDLQSTRLRRYVAEGARGASGEIENPGRANMPYARLLFASVAEGEGGRPLDLYRGNPEPDLGADALLQAARAGGEYLLRHQQADGSFDYNYLPYKDETKKDSYNALRHAGTCYALFELYAATHDGSFLTAGQKGVEWLLTQTRGPSPADAAADFEAIVSPGDEAKLGGAALAMLAMLEHEKVTGSQAFRPRLEKMGRFLVFQQEASGHFQSKYSWARPGESEFDSIYYPGEAILALTRLHAADGDPRWLAAAQKGADWLILERDKGKAVAELPHDHWLLMGLNELHPATHEARYLDQAKRIAEAIVTGQRRQSPWPDWVGSFYDPPRSTPAATRAEALVAMIRLAERNGIPSQAYRESLKLLAAFQLRCQLRPENSLYLPRPDRAAGGFRRGLEGGEVRIDYVQHSLSSLLGLRSLVAPP